MRRRSVASLVAAALLLGATGCGDEERAAEPQAEAEEPSESRRETAQRYEGAAARTEIPVVGTQDLPLPTPQAPPAPVGSDPALSLGSTIPTGPASALADPPGDGPVLVSTVEGEVLRVDLDGGTTQQVLDLRDRVTFDGEQGLLGMALGPADGRLYLDYTNLEGDTEIRSWPTDDEGMPVPSGEVLHLRIGQPYPTHNAGNLVFGPDGALWIATGDGGGFGDPGDVAQDDTSLLGKVLRVRPDPAGGVHLLGPDLGWARPEIWGIGLRNPWRWSFDRATNHLWIADVGQNRIEEVSVVAADASRPNFGWDRIEGTRPFEGDRSPSFVTPSIAYDRDDGCSITGGYVYRGARNPGLHGWYLYSDFCQPWVRAVPSDAPTSKPVELVESMSSVVSFGELEDGELVALTVAGVQRLLPPTDA